MAGSPDEVRTNGRRTIAWLSALITLGTFAIGDANLERIETGAYSEKITLTEASQMAAGQHRFGIVDYTHFPNGPIYLVAAMTALGLEVRTMRLLPVAVAALSVGFLVWTLLGWTSRLSLQVWALAGCVVLILQPAAVSWLGALHEHSYAFSLSLVAIAAAMLVTPRTSWLLFPLGFVAGWIGYDWLPGQAVLVLGTRWLACNREGSADLRGAAAEALLDTLKFSSGVALAILAHLGQLALYFDGWEPAARDLLGAAAARAGAESASQINPEYGRAIEQETARMLRQPGLVEHFDLGNARREPTRFDLASSLFGLFLRPLWSMKWLLAGTGLVGVLVTLYELAVMTRTSAASPRAGLQRAAVAAVAVALAFSATVIWTLLMPQHGLNHRHMLPRHGLMSIAALVTIPVLLRPRAGTGTAASEITARRLARSVALYAAFPALLVAAILHAAIAFG